MLEGLIAGGAADDGARRQRLSARGRDLEEYEITLEDDGASTTVIRDASTLTPEVKALVGYLKKCARPGAPSIAALRPQPCKASAGDMTSLPAAPGAAVSLAASVCGRQRRGAA